MSVLDGSNASKVINRMVSYILFNHFEVYWVFI